MTNLLTSLFYQLSKTKSPLIGHTPKSLTSIQKIIKNQNHPRAHFKTFSSSSEYKRIYVHDIDFITKNGRNNINQKYIIQTIVNSKGSGI